MGPATAWVSGLARVLRAPALLAGVWLLTLAVTLPFAIVLRDEIAADLGSSLVGDSAARGIDYGWMQEFAGDATGIGRTFGPMIVGFGAVLANASDFFERDLPPMALTLATGAHVLLWIFLAGGIIDRYARGRAVGAHHFFGVAGVFFFRFLRLALVAGAGYAAIFGLLHPWLFDDLFPRLTRDVTAERTAFAVRLLLYAVFALALAGCRLIFDYAKVRAVVEDRRSMIGATLAALRFIGRNPGAVGALYGANVLTAALVLAAYAVAAPGFGGSGWSVAAAFAIGQAYVAARLAVKLLFWSSAAALFQGRLAHAGYVAVPAADRPEPPVADGLIAPPAVSHRAGRGDA